MSLIKGRPLGSDITLINTWYEGVRKGEDGKWTDGSMTVVYKDNQTGKKYHQYTNNPKCRFYIAKPEEYIETNELFYPESKLDKIICPYKDQLKKIAELTGNLDFYYNNLKSGNSAANKELYTNVRIFDADYNIEDHWRAMFAEQYTNTITPINLSYMDIEADSIKAVGDFPEPGECPINAVTVIDDKHQEVHTFLLETRNNPLIQQFKRTVGPELEKELKAFIRDKVGGYKNEVRFGLDKLSFHFHFYKEEDEIRLIQDLFILINTYQPDFVLAWNMAFDIPYIIERIKKLGYRPEDIMCHPDFENKKVFYHIDDIHYSDFENRTDYAVISSYSVFIDQLINFASRRKGQSAFASYGLDYIGGEVAKVHKYDYHHITTNLSELPYKDYKTFVFYNIMDTVVQKCIEVRSGDTNFLFSKCNVNNTRYSKAHRQTIYLRNRAEKSFRTENDDVYIIGNNVNAIHPSNETFKGAFVANPKNITDYSKLRIAGRPVMLFDNMIDYDYKALYPSSMRQDNMAANTMIGFIDIPSQVYPNENRYNLDRFVRGGSFLEDLQSHVWLEFGSRWFGLPDYKKLYNEVKVYLASIGIYVGTYDYYSGLVNPFISCTTTAPILPNPFIEVNTDNLPNPFVITTPMPENTRLTEQEFREAQYANVQF